MELRILEPALRNRFQFLFKGSGVLFSSPMKLSPKA